ncbi:MAG: NADH-quinone oxidoreductase subunit NuoK [Verrucomicrobiota bacterium]
MSSVFTEITLNHYLALSGIIFMIGLAGVMLRRDLMVIYMCLELMLNAASLALISFSRFNVNRFGPDAAAEGQLMVLFIIAIAVAKAAVGLALIVALYRNRQTRNVNDLAEMRF